MAQTILPNKPCEVFFDTDDSTLTSKAKSRLDVLVTILKKPTAKYRLRLYSYCDIRGGLEYNDKLSDNRLLAVHKYLVRRGISTASITEEKGYGKRKPINGNANDAEMAMNRKVSVFIETLKDTARGLAQTVNHAATGSHIVLPDLNFYGGLHHILPQSTPVLDTLLQVLHKYPKMRLMIEGHVCCTENGDDGLDNETRVYGLSWNRAKEVYSWLISHGISAERLKYTGMAGKRHLINPEITEEDRIKNRRVEVVILGR